MPRVKMPSSYQGSLGEASSSRAPHPKRARVDQDERRREMMSKKHIVQERGLDLVALRQTFVPAVVQALAWHRVAHQELPYNEDIVREFYAMCDRATFRQTGRVAVHGRDVFITPARINEFYDLHVAPEIEGGLPELPEVSTNAELAAALRVNGSPLWGRHGEIKQAELHFPAAFWNLFSAHSAQPTRHTSDIAIKRARVVYCLMQSRQIDLGAIIHFEIGERSVGVKGILPFPGLITHFCMQAGIQIDPSYNVPAAPLIGHLSYNSVIHRRRGIQRVTRYGDLQPADIPAAPAEEEPPEDETDAVDESPAEQLFDIDTDLPPREHPARAAPSPSGAGPSQWQDQPAPPQPAPSQPSVAPEILQQILAGITQLQTQQQEFQATTEAKLTSLETQMAEQRLDMQRVITEQQRHHTDIQQRLQRVETNVGYIWSTGLVMQSQLRTFEMAIEEHQSLDPLRRYYRTRDERQQEAERRRHMEEFLEQQQQFMHDLEQQFQPPPPPEDIPDYQPADDDD